MISLPLSFQYSSTPSLHYPGIGSAVTLINSYDVQGLYNARDVD